MMRAGNEAACVGDESAEAGEAEEGQRRVDEADDGDRPPVAAHRRKLAAQGEQWHEDERGAEDAQEGERERAERRHRDAHEEERPAPEGGEREQLDDVASSQ